MNPTMPESTKSPGRLFIVEVDGFHGEHASISITDSTGAPLKALYCVARNHEETGVLQFVDYGYLSISEAKEAWPEAFA
jgi:hypothetical protein